MQLVKRVRLEFADMAIEFVDRERAIQQVVEWGEKGTALPVVVYGPEGCGKSAWLLQSIEVLRGLGYGVVYFNPVRKRFDVDVGIESLGKRAVDVVKQVSAEHVLAKLIWSVIDFVSEALRLGKKRLAIVVDDAFQYLEAREAAIFVKGVLEVIEHPREAYEKIVAIVATSEGFSRYEIGRHLWAWLVPMWNMSRKGFEELYERIPKPKPAFDSVWGLAGGNPRALSMLYKAGWNTSTVISMLIDEKGLSREFINKWRKWLEKAVEDPDVVSDADFPDELRAELIKRNLVVHHLRDRDPELWLDQPPPERDPELGIGRDDAWQAPLLREAVKKALEKYR